MSYYIDTAMTVELTCILCKHFRVDPAEVRYSDYTPGRDATVFCWKDHWTIEMYEDYVEDYMRKLLSAVTCKDFERA